MTTGERIKAARKKAGMTQAELAAKLDVPFQSISQWERDIRKPKYETIEKIAHALGIIPSAIRGYYTSDELIGIYINGAKTWATDFRFSEEQKVRLNEFLAEAAFRLKDLVNKMADAEKADGKILLTPEIQTALDSISIWTANALKYVNNDYSDDSQA